MTEGVAARDHDGVVACAEYLTYARVAPAEVVAALRSVDEGAPLLLRAEAALLLVRHGVREVGVARTLARAAVARVATPEDHSLSMALNKVVEEEHLRDEETFRLLVPGFVDGSDREGGSCAGDLAPQRRRAVRDRAGRARRGRRSGAA